MVKVLNREGIQRMVGRGAGSGSSGGSSGGGGGISLAQVDAAYVSKEFFNQLFTVHGKRTYIDPETEEEVTEDVIISPNQIVEGEYSLSNVEVSVGLWTQQFLSALGLNSGGGGGGATALTDLVDVALSNPQNGQVLMYNSSTGKWYNGTVQSGTDMQTVWQNLASSGNQQINASHMTDALNGYATQQWVGQQGYLTSSAISDMATKTWVGQQGFLTASAISDMATKTWVGQQGFITASAISDMATKTWVGQNCLGKNDTAAAATKLATARTLWGQPFDGQANVSGAMTDVGDMHFGNDSTRIIDSYGVPGFGWGQTQTSNSSWGVYNHYASDYSLYIKTNGCVGIGTTTPGCKLDVNGDGRFLNMLYVRSSGTTEGGEISLQGGTGYNDIEIDNYSGYLRMFRSGGGNCEFQFNPDSRLVHINGGNGSTLRIGDGMLVWDNANNALKAIKADGTSLNFYATGGVSALGMSAGVSQMDAMTFNHLKVNNSMTLNGSVNIITGSSSQILRTSNDSDCIYLLNFGTTSKETSHNYYFNQYDNVGLHGTNYNYDETWWIDPDGCAKFNRLYLDSTRYLYINGGTLYYYNGSTSRQIAFA